MIKAVLVEDEPLFRADMQELLKENFSKEIELVAIATSVATGIIEIEAQKPDLVLLDINLGDGTGFELLGKLQNQDFALVFVTGFDNHAIRAIKTGALDYIMKPIDECEFIEGVKKALDAITSTSNVEGSREVASQFYTGEETNKFVVSTTEATHVLEKDEIYYCSSEGNYTTFHTDLGEITVARPLKYFEDIFEKSEFIRCHRSYVVNKTHVSRYDKSGYIILNNGQEVLISERKKGFVIRALSS